jgi:hypothetical protein
MSIKLRKKTLYDAYRFPGFTAEREVKGRFGDRTALVIRLTRRSKKRRAEPAAPSEGAGTIGGFGTFGTSPVGTAAFISWWTSAGSTAGSAAP